MQFNYDKLVKQSLIILGFLSLSFIFIAGCYYKTMQSQELLIAKNNAQNRLSNLTSQVQSNLSEVSHEIQNLQANNAPQGVMIKLDEKFSNLKKNLTEIEHLISTEEDKKVVTNIESIVDKYQSDFFALTKAIAQLNTKEENGLLKTFNKQMQNIESIVNNSKDVLLKEKFLTMQSLQKSYLSNDNMDTTADQVIIAQKNFLDRVNHSAGDYTDVSKVMVQTISLMQSFDLIKISIEQKKNFSQNASDDQLQTGLRQLNDIGYKYEKQTQTLIADTEQQNFILFLISIGVTTIVFIIGVLILTRGSHAVNSTNTTNEDFFQDANVEFEYQE